METSGFATRLHSSVETVDPSVPLLHPKSSPDKQGPTVFLSLFLLAIALGLAARYAVPAALRATFETPSILNFKGFANLILAMVAVIVLHEAGHLAAAILLNFKVLALALGPFRIARSNGAWTFRFTPRSLFSGSVSAVPRSTQGWRARMLVVVAAGPLATLLTGLAAASLLLSLQMPPWTSTFLGAITQLSAFIVVLGLIPNSRDARVRNDARLLSVLRHDSQEARDILLYHVLTQLDLAGARPRDYPEELMRELAQTQGRPDLMLFSAHKIVLWALDRGQLSTAAAWDQRCLELCENSQPAARNLALAQSACLDVLLRNRLSDARDKFAELDWQTLSPAWLMYRSRAAYYLTTGNVPACLAAISQAQYAFPKHLPVYAFERSLLSELHRTALNLRPPELIGKSAAA